MGAMSVVRQAISIAPSSELTPAGRRSVRRTAIMAVLACLGAVLFGSGLACLLTL